MPDSSPDQSNDTSLSALARTCAADHTNFSKEERDIAFAAEVLAGALLSERQLAIALADWTLHGSTALADHLLQNGLLSQDKRIELEERSACRLKELGEGTGHDPLRADSSAKMAIDRLDDTGRVAKLLGISVATSGVKGDEAREHLAKYQLIRKLGQGGLGTVWLARDINMQRYVALKEVKDAGKANKTILDRFRREAEITGRLEHPGIVPVYQLGEDVASDRTFYAMRFLGKRTMQDAIVEYHERREEGDDNPMLLRHLLTSFVSVCQAIGHAHSRKVIHRDLKPENVAIDSFGQVIVIDWGLAKILDDGVLDNSIADAGLSDVSQGERTIEGQVLGSPLYMAPEQATGRLDEVDESTDIYGLGAILFAILSGYAPHEQSRESSGSSTTRQLITLIASGPTPRARNANPSVDPALDAICAKAMAKRRYKRYESATALAVELERWMAGEPVSAYHERLPQRIRRWMYHHRRISQLIASAIIVALVAGITLGIASRQNYVSARQARFEELRSDGREVELQLLAAAHDLGKDVRFMSTLPPIQAIIATRSGAVDDGESEGVWCGRLETIYEGLLRANPDYLAVSYVAVGTDQPQEIVRVERHATDQSYIRRVPQSRLARLETTRLLTEVIEMEPGDVRFSLQETLAKSHAKTNNRRLAAAIPIYDDQSGEAFGVVSIETNITRRIQTILNGLDERWGELYITDAEGGIWVTSHPSFGVKREASGMNITALVPETSVLFSPNARQRFWSDGYSVIAQRVQLDATDASCSLGIVQRHLSSYQSP